MQDDNVLSEAGKHWKRNLGSGGGFRDTGWVGWEIRVLGRWVAWRSIERCFIISRGNADLADHSFRNSTSLSLQVVHSSVGFHGKALILPFSGLGCFLLVFGGDLCTQVEVFSNTVEEVESVFWLGAHFSVLCFSLRLLTEITHTWVNTARLAPWLHSAWASFFSLLRLVGELI